MQLRFRESFIPLRHGDGHYVAALQNRSGELEALARATPETWDRLTPLLHVVGRKEKPVVFKRSTVVAWVKRLARAVGQHPCFLDILRLKATHPVHTTVGVVPVLSLVYELARKRGIRFVPVLPVTSHVTASHRNLVKDAAARDGRGVALRYPVSTIVLDPHASPLLAALTSLEVDVAHADLLVDLGWLSDHEEIEAEDMAKAIEEMRGVGDWRSIVLLGTSMPSQLGGVVGEGTVTPLPRLEWALWSAIRALNPARLPTYGDYAVQHPTPPRERGGPGMRANIRYTAGLVTLIARGIGPFISEGKAQYRTLCQKLTDREEFRGRGYSWGDQVIYDCAQGVIEPGAQDLWRGAGTSHHLRFVIDQLSS